MRTLTLVFALLCGLAVSNGYSAPGTFRFLTEDLPDGTTNTNYNSRLVAANADGAVTFGLDAGSDAMPAGLTLRGPGRAATPTMCKTG